MYILLHRIYINTYVGRQNLLSPCDNIPTVPIVPIVPIALIVLIVPIVPIVPVVPVVPIVPIAPIVPQLSLSTPRPPQGGPQNLARSFIFHNYLTCILCKICATESTLNSCKGLTCPEGYAIHPYINPLRNPYTFYIIL